MFIKIFIFIKKITMIINAETVRGYCLDKKCVTESFPFDETLLVLKVCDKIFAILSLDNNFRINLKCNPEKAIKLREEYFEIIPGYHMNKKHWNTVDLKGRLKVDFIKQLIDDSYNLVVAGLPKKFKDNFNPKNSGLIN